jgi:hypothetical protein
LERAGEVNPIRLTILGQAHSKANSRKPASVGRKGEKRTIWIKSDEARAFEESMLRQIPPACRVRIDVPACIRMVIYYRTELPDLDESLVLDCLQDRWSRPRKGIARQLLQAGVVTNDRLFREKHIYHGIDRVNPRVEIQVAPITRQLFDFEAEDHLPF